jgi:regulator of sigma E protease
MEGLIMAGQLLLGLGLLVFIHELGHFVAARMFGIRVDKFFVFFDFGGYKIYSKKVGDTEYGIGWFPLGGYVKIAGMIDESIDKEFLSSEPQPWEFRSKPAWQRFIVMIAGITMNIILGIIIFAFYLKYYEGGYKDVRQSKHGIYAYELAREHGLQTGDRILKINGNSVRREKDLRSLKVFFGAELTVERDGRQAIIRLPDDLFRRFSTIKDHFVALENYPFIVDSILPETSAMMAGLQKGDRLIAVNDIQVPVFGSFREALISNAEKEVKLTVVRHTDTLTLSAQVSKEGTLGFFAAPAEDDAVVMHSYTWAEALVYGLKEGFEAIDYNAVGLGKIFTGKVDATESVQSPIGIAKIYGGKWEWKRFWYLTGLISFVLAFMNILPIPALDGGHVVFIIIEVIQGKPVSEKVLERAQVIGMVMLLALMVFAFGNDIYKEFINK